MDTQSLEGFFTALEAHSLWFMQWTGKAPRILYINPDILQQLSRIEGFFQRPELGTEVTVYAPVVRYMKLKSGVVTLIEDLNTPFLHFDSMDI